MGFVPTHAASCRTLAFPLSCRRCGSGVYFFSCSCGSAVLFDGLGGSWPIHDCEAATTKAGLNRAREILDEGRGPDAGAHRPFAGLADLIDVDALPKGRRDDLDALQRESPATVALRPEHIIKPMDPVSDGEPHVFIGFLRERVPATTKLKALHGSLGDLGLKMLGLPPLSRAVQVTIVDASGTPNESYTAVADKGLFEAGATPGRLVGLSLVGRVGSGYAFWLVTEIQVL